ncbi:MAG: hypothetical protein JKX85_03710, partial [Phycisphaeraceae bacterium]|nr:hypothetical protein [Phycisphaeraceae bacterium]
MMHTLNSLTLSLLIAISLTVTAHAQDTADTLLDRIEAKSDTIQTYQADIRFDQIQGLLGDQQTRFGKLYYVVKPHVKFAVHFQRVVIDGKLREQNRQWIYDGTWLVEKL